MREEKKAALKKELEREREKGSAGENKRWSFEGRRVQPWSLNASWLTFRALFSVRGDPI
jgi:hypothetical protein